MLSGHGQECRRLLAHLLRALEVREVPAVRQHDEPRVRHRGRDMPRNVIWNEVTIAVEDQGRDVEFRATERRGRTRG